MEAIICSNTNLESLFWKIIPHGGIDESIFKVLYSSWFQVHEGRLSFSLSESRIHFLHGRKWVTYTASLIIRVLSSNVKVCILYWPYRDNGSRIHCYFSNDRHLNLEKMIGVHFLIYSLFLSKNMDQGGGVLELHTQELKMPHAMIMQDFGMWLSLANYLYIIAIIVILIACIC